MINLQYCNGFPNLRQQFDLNSSLQCLNYNYQIIKMIETLHENYNSTKTEFQQLKEELGTLVKLFKQKMEQKDCQNQNLIVSHKSGPKKFKCSAEKCQRVYRSKIALNRHIKIKHTVTSQENIKKSQIIQSNLDDQFHQFY